MFETTNQYIYITTPKKQYRAWHPKNLRRNLGDLGIALRPC